MVTSSQQEFEKGSFSRLRRAHGGADSNRTKRPHKEPGKKIPAWEPILAGNREAGRILAQNLGDTFQKKPGTPTQLQGVYSELQESKSVFTVLQTFVGRIGVVLATTYTDKHQTRD